VSEIAQVTQQTAAGTKQAADSISSLANLADGLRDSVSAFKLPDGDGKVPEAETVAS
jgi:methyl-accepting chemotaxis protein